MKNKTKPLKSDSLIPDSQEHISVSQKSSLFPVVGIGASAGGLEALEQFLLKHMKSLFKFVQADSLATIYSRNCHRVNRYA